MSKSPENITVALVDNSASYLEARAALLASEGLTVIQFLSNADNYRSLAQEIAASNPDVVVTGVRNVNDRNSYDSSGISLAHALQALGIKVIVNSSEEYRAQAIESDLPFVSKGDGYSGIVIAILQLMGRFNATGEQPEESEE